MNSGFIFLPFNKKVTKGPRNPDREHQVGRQGRTGVFPLCNSEVAPVFSDVTTLASVTWSSLTKETRRVIVTSFLRGQAPLGLRSVEYILSQVLSCGQPIQFLLLLPGVCSFPFHRRKSLSTSMFTDTLYLRYVGISCPDTSGTRGSDMWGWCEGITCVTFSTVTILYLNIQLHKYIL